MKAGKEKITIRYIEPPIDYGFFIDANPRLPVKGFLKAPLGDVNREIVLVPGLNHVLWAACKDNQTSGEFSIGGNVRGLFTYCFCKSVRKSSIMSSKVSRSSLDKMVASCLKELNAGQVHQLEGTIGAMKKEVFT